MSIKMYTTTSCGACQLVKASGVVEELGIEVINITDNPEAKPEAMSGAPFFIKEDGGKTTTHTGYANAEMLKNL